jgi:hypothetical protein
VTRRLGDGAEWREERGEKRVRVRASKATRGVDKAAAASMARRRRGASSAEEKTPVGQQISRGGDFDFGLRQWLMGLPELFDRPQRSGCIAFFTVNTYWM